MIPLSILPYRFKKNKTLSVLSVIGVILLFPLVTFQVYKSWNQASKKIKEGPLIESLK